jgi:hypothetical protein
MSVKKDFYANLSKSLLGKFEKRRFEAYYCETKGEALKKALEIIPEDSVVSFGGTMTVKEIGLTEALRNGKYKLIDREEARNAEEKAVVTRQAMDCDYYLMSTNAFTSEGELVNIDGNGNRVAALCYGPKNIIVIAGMNKLAEDRENGIWRVQNVASPQNTIRLEKKTPCAITGECGDCYGDSSICSQIVITRRSHQKGRIKVILVGEELGY